MNESVMMSDAEHDRVGSENSIINGMRLINCRNEKPLNRMNAGRNEFVSIQRFNKHQ